MKTISVLYEGKVQGVGFRSSVLSLAKGYEVSGWVRNLPDGRVELLACGDTAELEDFLLGIRESHLAGHIERESILPSAPEAGLKGFRIIP
jgi:acylphosphatase